MKMTDMLRKVLINGAMLLLLLLLCMNVQAEEFKNPDPWEGFNRKIFVFNDTADKFVMRPLAVGYDTIMPQFLDNGLTNMFGNAGELRDMFNNLFQGKFKNAGIEAGRILINTTIGVGGFFEVAGPMGLEKKSEDLGQTLAFWGMPSGPYLMLPILGPSTVRDGIAMVPDGYLDFATTAYHSHIPTRNTIMALDNLKARARLLEAETLITGDRYGFIRDAFLQNREYQIKDGVVEDTFGEEDFDDEW